MKLTRYSPSFDLGRVADFDQWLRDPFAGFPVVGQFLSDLMPEGSGGRLRADVHEDADNYYAKFELPGVKKEDLKIEVHNQLLTVTAERRETTQGAEEQSFKWSRAISVPEGVNDETIGAKLEDGILTVTLPKQENRKPKVIEIA